MNTLRTLNNILSHNHSLFFQNLNPPKVETIECRDLLDKLDEETGLVSVFLETRYPDDPENWDLVVNALKVKNIQLIDRKLTGKGQPIVFFSGGLESTFLALSCPGARFINVPDIVEVADDYDLPLAEPLFALICRALGHTTYLTGQEYMPETNVPDHLTHCANNWMAVWASYVGVTQISPVIYAEKYDLYKRARQLGMMFASCDEEDGSYCNNCFKCFQINAFQRWADLEKLTSSPVVNVSYDGEYAAQFISEIEDYKKSGIDLHRGDNNTFVYAEQVTHTTLTTLYKDKLL